ncbi:MAG: cytochrome c biogenesis protein CcdA [Patescibacteria group bacterium]
MKRKLKIVGLVSAAAVLIGVIVFLKTNLGSVFVWNISNGGKLILPLVTVAALIDSINPCAFSVLLITIAFLFSLNKSRGEILKIGGFYVLGLFLVYILIGLGFLQALHLFNTPHFMDKIGAGFLIVWALINLVNEFFPRFPIKLKIPNFAHAKMGQLMHQASLPTAFLLGMLVGLCEFPCTGGPYLMVLGLLHDTGTWGRGLGYLLYYNLIFILPLVIALVAASNQTLLAKVDYWRKQETKQFKIWGSVAMILLALAMLAF